MKVLVGGVGYRNLRDLSLGPVLFDRCHAQPWPEGVEWEDLSYGPIAILHALEERGPIDRMVLVAGVKRDRPPGTIHAYPWTHALPDVDEIQARVAEAAAGVIDLDNLLIIATYFKKLPQDVRVIEIEAANENFGEELSPTIEGAIPEVMNQVRRAIEAS